MNWADAYTLAYTIRHTEEEIARRYEDGKMRCPTHLSIGQEIPAVAMALSYPGAFVYSTHRCHAHYLAWGGSIDGLIAELYGKATGCAAGVGGSMHLVDESKGVMGTSAVVGSSISVAVGHALGLKLDGSDGVVVAFMGDAGPETGQFWEALNFTFLKQLPILFVIEDNQYSTQTHIDKRRWLSPINMENVESLWFSRHRPLEDMVNLIPMVKLPAVIEFATYRFREHVGPNYDWHLGYRSEREVKDKIENDPMQQFEQHLGSAVQYNIEWGIRQKVSAAFSRAEMALWPVLVP